MPKRRDKREDTSNSDDYDQDNKFNKRVTFGSVQINSFVPPDLIDGDDATKYSILAWSNTLQAQRLLPWEQRKLLFQRALKYLPFSYKIWHMYLKEYSDFCSTRTIYSKQYKQLNQAFERALQKLPKMPRIWLMYTQVLQKQQMISKVRSVFNWSFRNLPLTQHNKIWHKFSVWSMKLDNSATALKVIPRYLKINPDFKEEFANYLKDRDLLDQCIDVILKILDDDGYHSKAGNSKKDFELQIIDIVVEHPDKVTNINGEQHIRKCIEKYPQDQGKLWTKLSDYFIRLGQFEKARESFEQALQAIDNVKDFGVIFNAYTKFQEQMITALGDDQIQQYAAVQDGDNVDFQIESRLKKLQDLIDRQPFMICRINVKRSPNDVRAWISYAELYNKSQKFQQCLQTINLAIQTIKPELAENGLLSSIWIKLANQYQQSEQIRQCNEIFHQATQVNYKMVEDYFNIWIRWIEMLLQQHFYQDALRVVKHVLFKRKNSITSQSSEEKKQSKLQIKNIDDLLRSNISLWQLYIDIEISIGNFQTVKTAYQRCKDHKSLTPIMLLNFTNFLWTNAYFEQAFRVFQFAINSFKWPSLYEIWISYLNKFIDRYGDDPIGVERTRSIFERLLKSCPSQRYLLFHYMYAKFEEDHGMISHAINIYDDMVNKVAKEERAQAYCIYICKVAKILGITKTRAIFESALQKLSQKEILKIGQKYAELQCNLGQIDRARAIFIYISQFTDPRDDYDGLWKLWQEFQVEHGDKQTYKEYLRINRSVEAKYEMLPPDLDKIQDKVKKGLL